MSRMRRGMRRGRPRQEPAASWPLEMLETRTLLSAVDYVFTSLASFDGDKGPTNNGATPYTLAIDPQGNLIGTASGWGANRGGTVYQYTPGSSTIQTRVDLELETGFYGHGDLVVDAQGNLFGTITSGGANGKGGIFELPAGSNAITFLLSFDGTNGSYPAGGLIADAQGNFYGTTTYGGTYDRGTVFKFTPGSNTLTTLATFDIANGSLPVGSLTIDAQGNLYGTTQNGGLNDAGTVFRIAAGSNTLTTLWTFDEPEGSYPVGSLTLDAQGNLYGVTSRGGTYEVGTIFVIPAGTTALTALASFNGYNGSYGVGNLLLDAQGNLYGVAGFGGDYNYGTVYELPAGSSEIIALHSFNGDDGYNPVGTLIADAQGNLFGTTAAGGVYNYGTIFELQRVSSNFVPNLYRDLLGRAPDTEGLAYWNAQLSAGMAPETVAANFLNSVEYRTNLIDAVYQGALGREVDPMGLSYWLDAMNHGVVIETVEAGVFGSQEFYSVHGGTNAGAIDAMYRGILGRPADAGGLDAWSRQLADGATLSQIAATLITSQEASQARVVDIYAAFLRRTPDAAGLSYWSGQLMAGASQIAVIDRILGMAEYYSA